MLEPIIDDLAKLWGQFKTAVVIVILVALSFWVARCTAARDAVTKERVKVLTHEIKVAVPVYITDTVTAYRTRIRYDRTQIHDTVVRHDSVFVYKPLADTAINACTAALHDCEHLRVVNDSLLVQVKKQRRTFWNRIGVSVGPALVAKSDGTVTWGIGATVGVRVWP